MASNAYVQQGTVNRLRGAVVFSNYSYLNVNAAFLAKEAISIAFEGDTSLLIGTLTGAIQSPEPYTFGTVTIHLLRTQALADIYKRQIELNTMVGSVDIIGDSDALSNFQLENCVLQSLDSITFDGNTAGLVVKLKGVYNINSALWS